MPNLRHTNEGIGAYVIAGARILLYGFIYRLQENSNYCDSDSVIFIQPSAKKCSIATGDNLGDMQSELKPSEYIDEISSEGQIYYAYRVIANEGYQCVCKIRGITPNYHDAKLVNFEVIREMILEQGEPIVNVHTEHKTTQKEGRGNSCYIDRNRKPEVYNIVLQETLNA